MYRKCISYVSEMHSSVAVGTSKGNLQSEIYSLFHEILRREEFVHYFWGASSNRDRLQTAAKERLRENCKKHENWEILKGSSAVVVES